ncbi:MAG TPA: cytochrome P460 family protein [Bacteroidia bacterium]|nr:cytochrome P460 family protein [Bacteroidia bacterium]
MGKHYFQVVGVLMLLIILSSLSCKQEKNNSKTDQDLYDIASSYNGFTWYKNDPSFLNKSSGSGHAFPKLRTRYNLTASAVLDSNFKVTPGSVFPQESAIVKELFNSNGLLARYAVLYKRSANKDADANGWVWGYINADGSVEEPAANKGAACSGCHSQTDNIDYMLMNKYFP